MFFVIGNWRLADGEIDSDEITRIAAEVSRQQGVVGDCWRRDPADAERALALLVLEDEASVPRVVKALRAQIPTADLRAIKVLAHA